MNSKIICSYCKKERDASLDKCPLCGFSEPLILGGTDEEIQNIIAGAVNEYKEKLEREEQEKKEKLRKQLEFKAQLYTSENSLYTKSLEKKFTFDGIRTNELKVASFKETVSFTVFIKKGLKTNQVAAFTFSNVPKSSLLYIWLEIDESDNSLHAFIRDENNTIKLSSPNSYILD